MPGFDILETVDTEKAAELIERCLKDDYSDELDIDPIRQSVTSSIFTKLAQRKDNGRIIGNVSAALDYSMKRYDITRHDRDDDVEYLRDLLLLGSILRVPYTKEFAETVTKSTYYQSLDDDTKGLLNRVFITFEQESKPKGN